MLSAEVQKETFLLSALVNGQCLCLSKSSLSGSTWPSRLRSVVQSFPLSGGSICKKDLRLQWVKDSVVMTCLGPFGPRYSVLGSPESPYHSYCSAPWAWRSEGSGVTFVPWARIKVGSGWFAPFWWLILVSYAEIGGWIRSFLAKVYPESPGPPGPNQISLSPSSILSGITFTKASFEKVPLHRNST